MSIFKYNRAIKIIEKGISNLELDLSSKIILTEVGSNNYLFTPIIAALAGAKKVYAWTRDSTYGNGVDIKNDCFEIAGKLGVKDRIEISVNQQPIEHVKSADIITNSGFLRPLNKEILSFTKRGVVIPLMFEAWEVREDEIDLAYCKKQRIKVAGTWENHPKILVFEYVKELAVKMIHEAGFEIMGNNFAVWSDDHFGEKVKEGLAINGAKEVTIFSDYSMLMNKMPDIDVLFICDYDEKRPYFSPTGIFDIKTMKKLNNAFGVVHLYGNVDSSFLEKEGINVYPKTNGTPLNMTYTLGHVGLIPIIMLQVAGFKVGQEMIERKESKLTQPITY